MDSCECCGISPSHYAELRAENERLRAELASADRRNGAKDREIARLKCEQADEQIRDPRYPDACDVLRYWQDVLAPASREPFSKRRVDAVFGRLGKRKGNGIEPHYTVEQLKRCIDGYGAYPFQGEYGKRMTAGRPDQRKIDADFIFRDEKHVQNGLMLADGVDAHETTFSNGNGNGHANGELVLSDKGAMAVLLVARFNWYVFPCLPNDKRPATTHGLLDAKADEVAVRAYWMKKPNANLAVRCGVDSGIVVLDVDGEHGLENLLDLEKEFGRLPKTLSVKTPRGGEHYYFAHPGGTVHNTVCVPRPGLDIRGDGGYVLVPPSVVNGRLYEADDRVPLAPMPLWLLKAITDEQARISRQLASGEWAELMLECVHQGMRHDRMLKIAGHKLGRGQPSDEVLADCLNMNVANWKPPLPVGEIETIVVDLAASEARKPLKLAL